MLDTTPEVAATCNGLDCELTPDLVLPAGEYFWEIRATNAWGTGLPSAQARFTVPQFPTLAVDDAAVVEGDSGFTRIAVPLRLSAAGATPVSLRWQTVAGSATAGTDFAVRDEQVTLRAVLERRGGAVDHAGTPEDLQDVGPPARAAAAQERP